MCAILFLPWGPVLRPPRPVGESAPALSPPAPWRWRPRTRRCAFGLLCGWPCLGCGEGLAAFCVFLMELEFGVLGLVHRAAAAAGRAILPVWPLAPG